MKYLTNFFGKPDVRPSNTYFKDTHTNEKMHANLLCYNDNVIAVTLICCAFHVSCSKGSVSIRVWFPFVLLGMCWAVLNIFHLIWTVHVQ